MVLQIPVEKTAVCGRETEGGAIEVAPDLAYVRLPIVNVVLFGRAGAGDGNWMLIDAGTPGARGKIERAADARFGKGARPGGILLTHGHFDHVGVLEDLASDWDVPVFAHPQERPYLDGSQSYPKPDPTAGGGLMTLLSPLYPRSPVDVSQRLRQFPADGSVPGMPGWSWVHTPGHTPGHVSFWHAGSRTLIAGDAVITTGQESAYEVAVQKPELHGPPRYFTPDWDEAERSVLKLSALSPEVIVSGHGPALHGAEMRDALHQLATRFQEVAAA